LAINTIRFAGRANIARDLHDRADVFAVYGIQQTRANHTTTGP